MRILFVTEEPSPLSLELVRLGHDVRVTPPSARRCLKVCTFARPEVAYLRAHSARVIGVLEAMRVPYALEIDRIGGADPKTMLIARAARTIVATGEEEAQFAVHTLGAREASIVPPGIDLPPLDTIDREEAKRRLGLQPGLRIVTMAGALDEGLRLDLLAEAHRKLAGIGLVVIGDGPQASFIQAMRAATRPSSPVLFLGTRPKEEETLAILAAEACVNLRGPKAEYAALGRRQVALHRDERIEALFPEELGAVRIANATPIALRAALEEAIDAADLPREAVDAARTQLGWTHSARQLAQVLGEIRS